MDRRKLIAAGLVTLGAPSLVRAQETALPTPPPPAPSLTEGPPPPAQPQPTYAAKPADSAYSRDEIVDGVSNFMGVTAEVAGGAVERIFSRYGEPTAYIAGEEGSGALVIGARYGRGLLYMKNKEPVEVFWQGPSAGWDFGGNASRVFTLCYDLHEPEVIFQRFPGVEGSAYFVGGLGVNYQKAAGVTLAPIRAGVGIRLGANLGYLSYSRKRSLLPF